MRRTLCSRISTAVSVSCHRFPVIDRYLFNHLAQHLRVPFRLHEDLEPRRRDERIHERVCLARRPWIAQHARVRHDTEKLVANAPRQEPGGARAAPMLEKLATPRVFACAHIRGVQQDVVSTTNSYGLSIER